MVTFARDVTLLAQLQTQVAGQCKLIDQINDQLAYIAQGAAKSSEPVYASRAMGDVVSLLMLNRPEFVLTWLGLSKAGIITALINTSATGVVLRHAMTQVNSQALIIDQDLIGALDTLDGPVGIPVLVDIEAGQEFALAEGE